MRPRSHCLRVVEQREVQPLGAHGPRQLDLRILASSKIDLDAGRRARPVPRKICIYRLNVLKLRVPPLRERRGGRAVAVRPFPCQARVGRAAAHAAADDAPRCGAP